MQMVDLNTGLYLVHPKIYDLVLENISGRDKLSNIFLLSSKEMLLTDLTVFILVL